jgi:AcrR family transcriptional regulator
MPKTSAAAATVSWRNAIPSHELTPILGHALDAFYELGYHGTSVRDIAKRTGQTVPALYYHHENKEAILFTLLDDSINAVVERCERALNDAGDDQLMRLRNLIEGLVLYMTQHGKRAAMDAEIRALGPENRERYIAKRNIVEQMLETAITAGEREGIFTVSSAHETTRALLGMIFAITVWFKPGGKKSPAAVAASYIDIALHTVGYQAASPGRQRPAR